MVAHICVKVIVRVVARAVAKAVAREGVMLTAPILVLVDVNTHVMAIAHIIVNAFHNLILSDKIRL